MGVDWDLMDIKKEIIELQQRFENLHVDINNFHEKYELDIVKNPDRDHCEGYCIWCGGFESPCFTLTPLNEYDKGSIEGIGLSKYKIKENK